MTDQDDSEVDQQERRRHGGRNRPTRPQQCLAEGCERDMALESPYYQRCKVCKAHAQAYEVVRDGQLQRFCQQCSTLHALKCFEGHKRSCIASLSRRPKKPAPAHTPLPPAPADFQSQPAQPLLPAGLGPPWQPHASVPGALHLASPGLPLQPPSSASLPPEQRRGSPVLAGTLEHAGVLHLEPQPYPAARPAQPAQLPLLAPSASGALPGTAPGPVAGNPAHGAPTHMEMDRDPSPSAQECSPGCKGAAAQAPACQSLAAMLAEELGKHALLASGAVSPSLPAGAKVCCIPGPTEVMVQVAVPAGWTLLMVPGAARAAGFLASQATAPVAPAGPCPMLCDVRCGATQASTEHNEAPCAGRGTADLRQAAAAPAAPVPLRRTSAASDTRPGTPARPAGGSEEGDAGPASGAGGAAALTLGVPLHERGGAAGASHRQPAQPDPADALGAAAGNRGVAMPSAAAQGGAGGGLANVGDGAHSAHFLVASADLPRPPLPPAPLKQEGSGAAAAVGLGLRDSAAAMPRLVSRDGGQGLSMCVEGHSGARREQAAGHMAVDAPAARPELRAPGARSSEDVHGAAVDVQSPEAKVLQLGFPALQAQAASPYYGAEPLMPDITGGGGAGAAGEAPKLRDRAAVVDYQLCMIEGCNRNLRLEKPYCRRYSMCSDHLLSPQVLKDGQPHRFCQQCCKLQPLAEFEGTKRSCSKALAKVRERGKRRQMQQFSLGRAAEDGATCVDNAADSRQGFEPQPQPQTQQLQPQIQPQLPALPAARLGLPGLSQPGLQPQSELPTLAGLGAGAAASTAAAAALGRSLGIQALGAGRGAELSLSLASRGEGLPFRAEADQPNALTAMLLASAAAQLGLVPPQQPPPQQPPPQHPQTQPQPQSQPPAPGRERLVRRDALDLSLPLPRSLGAAPDTRPLQLHGRAGGLRDDGLAEGLITIQPSRELPPEANGLGCAGIRFRGGIVAGPRRDGAGRPADASNPAHELYPLCSSAPGSGKDLRSGQLMASIVRPVGTALEQALHLRRPPSPPRHDSLLAAAEGGGPPLAQALQLQLAGAGGSFRATSSADANDGSDMTRPMGGGRGGRYSDDGGDRPAQNGVGDSEGWQAAKQAKSRATPLQRRAAARGDDSDPEDRQTKQARNLAAFLAALPDRSLDSCSLAFEAATKANRQHAAASSPRANLPGSYGLAPSLDLSRHQDDIDGPEASRHTYPLGAGAVEAGSAALHRLLDREGGGQGGPLLAQQDAAHASARQRPLLVQASRTELPPAIMDDLLRRTKEGLLAPATAPGAGVSKGAFGRAERGAGSRG